MNQCDFTSPETGEQCQLNAGHDGGMHVGEVLPSDRDRVRTRLAKLLHHKLAAAQNLPYEDGDVCEDCFESVDLEFLPIVQPKLEAAFQAGVRTGKGDVAQLFDEKLAAAMEAHNCSCFCPTCSEKTDHSSNVAAAREPSIRLAECAQKRDDRLGKLRETLDGIAQESTMPLVNETVSLTVIHNLAVEALALLDSKFL